MTRVQKFSKLIATSKADEISQGALPIRFLIPLALATRKREQN
jgi:hypothetical protein